MNRMLPFLLSLSLVLIHLHGFDHPGIGMVKDSKGNIYYTDLQQVWKITNGKKVVVVPNVHTHELYMDGKDNLYGEHVTGGSGTSSLWYYYIWVLRSNGVLDTAQETRQAYIDIGFSFARDVEGNEYYTKQFIPEKDTIHIYKRTPDGRESVIATGNFKGVSWLHPQKDQSILFTRQNNIYRLTPDGVIKEVASNLANEKPSFTFSGKNKLVWGIWEDDSGNVYVAVFSDQTVKKINVRGEISNYYTSKGNWTPLYGVFDNQNRLWVLETSDKNDIRATLAENMANEDRFNKRKGTLDYLFMGIALLLVVTFIYLMLKNRRHSK